jgi:hypothetical protein
LDADPPSFAAVPPSKDIDPVLRLAGPAIVLNGRVSERQFKQQPAVAFQCLPVFRLGYCYGGEIGHLRWNHVSRVF